MILDYLFAFLAGGILINALPHLLWGMSGRHFPEYSEEERRHLPKIILLISSPLVNAVWGLVNLFGGLALLLAIGFELKFDLQGLFFALGMVAVVLVLCMKMTHVHSRKE